MYESLGLHFIRTTTKILSGPGPLVEPRWVSALITILRVRDTQVLDKFWKGK